MEQADCFNQSTICMEIFMNPLLLKEILNYINCFDVQRLRKVSRGIRNCIDFIKPDPRIRSICIKGVNTRQFILKVNLAINKSASIEYSGNWLECFIYVKNQYWQQVNSDFLSVLCADFELITRFQKSTIKGLCLQFSYEKYFGKHQPEFTRDASVDLLKLATMNFLNVFKKTLAARKHPLKVKELHMEATSQEEIMEVLPYLDPNSLNTIGIQYPFISNTRKLENINKISKLRQWKKAKKLEIYGCIISSSVKLMNITHFVDSRIFVDTISIDDIVYLIKELHMCQSLNKMDIRCLNTPSSSYLEVLLGESHNTREDVFMKKIKSWYYKIPNSDLDFLFCVSCCASQSFTFSRVHSSSIPEDAVVQG